MSSDLTDQPAPFIVFSYGSLLFKPPPHVISQVSGYLKGYVRRFAQKSHDHRGTPSNPGRVVTLVHKHDWDMVADADSFSNDSEVVWGIAYTIDPEYEAEVRAYLGWIHARNSGHLRTCSSSQEDAKLDNLFMRTSPETEPWPCEELEATKMGITRWFARGSEELTGLAEMEVARTRRVGSKAGCMDHVLLGKTIDTFLTPLLAKTRHANPIPVDDLSLIGEHSSQSSTLVMSDRLDTEISKMYERQDPYEIILLEKLDGKQESLMELPSLPAPNIHVVDVSSRITCLAQLTAAAGPHLTETQILGCGPILRKVKGLPSLRLALSWVPFTTQTKLPSHADITKVSSFLDPSVFPDGYDASSWRAYMDGVMSADQDQIRVEKDHWGALESAMPVAPALEQDPCLDIIHSRRPRRTQDVLQDELEEIDASHIEDLRPNKRARLEVEFQVPASPYDPDAGGEWSPSWHIQDTGDMTLDVDPSSTAYEDGSTYSYEGFLVRANGDAFLNQESETTDKTLTWPSDSQSWMFENSAQLGDATYIPEEQSADQAMSYRGLYRDASLVGSPSFAKSTMGCEQNECEPSSVVRGSSRPPLQMPRLATQPLGVASFAQLRAKNFDVVQEAKPHEELEALAEVPASVYEAPQDLFDRNTLALPQNYDLPNRSHKYLCSIAFLQKQALIRCLRSREARIDVVARGPLGGMDLIIDVHTSVVFASLLSLPSRCEDLVGILGDASWVFEHILVIFESYPGSVSVRGTVSGTRVSAYTPPIVKAVRRVRRDIEIAAACGRKRGNTKIQWAFANDLSEAAYLTRYFGDMAESRDDTGGELWGQRDWLDDEVIGEETNLAQIDSMNRFKAALVLRLVSTEGLFAMNAKERSAVLERWIGKEAMDGLNARIEHLAAEQSNSEMEDTM